MHLNVLCISHDCTSAMYGLCGEVFDYFDEDNEQEVTINGVNIGDILDLGELKKIEGGLDEIGAIVDHGVWHDISSTKEAQEIISKYGDDEWCKVYDVHI